MKRNGKLHLEDYVSEKGENPNGVTLVTRSHDQVGTEPKDLLGRQQFEWGGSRDGDFGGFGPEFFLSEKDKAAMYGPAASIPSAPMRKKR